MRLLTVPGSLCLGLLTVSLSAIADDELPFSTLKLAEPAADFSETQECVEPEAEMRRNHMKYILHQRDKTMHEGIRTRQYSLEECINCHASKDENGKYVRIEDTRHFCATCHTYAAVHIDCFQCHSDVPVRASTLRNLQSGLTQRERRRTEEGSPGAASFQLLAAERKTP